MTGGAAPKIVFQYEDRRVEARYHDPAKFAKSLDAIQLEAEEKLELPPGTYDFYDQFGKIEEPEDLLRALRMAGASECIVQVREHPHFVKLRDLQKQLDRQAAKLIAQEAEIVASEQRSASNLDLAKKELKELISRLEMKISREVQPVIEDLCRDRNQLQKESRITQEKIGRINLEEMREIAEKAATLQEEVRSAVKRVNVLDSAWATDKATLHNELARTQLDVRELQRHIGGKIDVLLEADADLRRQQQLTNERMQLLQDDLRLFQEDLSHLTTRCSGALEESEELRTLLGQVREDNEHCRSDTGTVMTRVHCLEGAALEKWDGFAPGVLYFRRWHTIGKGADVQLNADLSVATGRGFLAATGVVLGSDEGLSVADGPCRRFGTPGMFSSYYEIEVEEICAAPAGAGGLYVGLTLQSGEEIAAHPRHEFDGWLVGGPSKALICRASTTESLDESDEPSKIPATFAVDISEGAQQAANEAVKLLRAAIPPRPKGDVREVESFWPSQDLRMKDRIGVLFKCHRDGGARLRISVNGVIKCTHEFIDAPPAEAVGFLTPVVRLAGNGKSVRLLPGLEPPSRMLADP